MEREPKDILQLERELNGLNLDDPLAFINFYERNTNAIDSIEISKDAQHYYFKLRLFYKYGLNLAGRGEYTKSVTVLEKALKMFDRNPRINTEDGREIISIESLLWNYGASLWETKQIERSKTVFERLVKDYPNNDKYKKWLNGLLDERLSKITQPFWIVGGIWLVCELTIFKNFDSNTQFWLSIGGALILLTLLALELVGYLMKRKSTRVHKNNNKSKL
ncbi:tetratricopeptide repeat protein [Crocinitomix catalasitica]|uniref:tetratricopeptide repeat protein n=1 Tax=Crocinitomix catalasitica TaxID=184607 RepID=UPI00048965A7|nr:tetratricopeptide repeat protein [Crocinitomix catalasitica]